MFVRESFKLPLFAFCLIGPQLFSNPQNPQVTHGNVSFHHLNDATLEITASDRAIVNWETFSIDAHELTRFVQPSAQAAVLNRVHGSIPTSIFGTLEANGRIYFINPHGIIVGPKGSIDTSSVLFSTLDICDADFLNGNTLAFLGESESSIVNYGKISALQGDVILLARNIQNEGNLFAPNGECLIGAGKEILIQPDGKDKILIRLQNADKKTEIGIDQKGQIEALRAEMKADGNLYALAVKHTGKTNATRLESRGGEIYLIAESGNIEMDGCFSAPEEVRITGASIRLLDHVLIDATNDEDGGSIYIGGGMKGQNPDIPNAETLYVAKGCSLDASSRVNGKGGQVVLWSQKATGFFGEIKAGGGSLSGDGGFVEVSSHDYLAFEGRVDTQAAYGKAGTLLLDPSNVTIQANGGADSNATFNSVGNCALGMASSYSFTATPSIIDNGLLATHLNNCNVTIDSSTPSGPGTGSITVANNITWNKNTSLTLLSNNSASDSITITANISNLDTTLGNANCIVITSPNITIGDMGGLSNPQISAASGNLNITGTTAVTIYNSTIEQLDTLPHTLGSLSISGGTFTATTVNNGTISITSQDAPINCHASSITTSNPGAGSLNFNAQASGNVSVQANSGAVYLDQAVGVISQTGSVSVSSSGLLTLKALNANITAVTGPITVNAGSLSMEDSTAIGRSTSGFVDCTITNSATLFANTGSTTISSGSAGMTFTADSLTIQSSPVGANIPIAGLVAGGGVLTCTAAHNVTIEATNAGSAQILNTGTGGSIQFSAGSLSISSGSSGQGAPPLYNGLVTVDGDINCIITTGDLTLTGNGWYSVIRNEGAATSRTVQVTSNTGNAFMLGGLTTQPGVQIQNGNGDVTVDITQGNLTMDFQSGNTTIASGANGAPGSTFVTTGGDLICKLTGALGGAGNGSITTSQGSTFINVGGNFNMLGGNSVNSFSITGSQLLDIKLTKDMNLLHDTVAPIPSGSNGFILIDGGAVSISRNNVAGVSNITAIGGSGSNSPILLLAPSTTIDINGTISLQGGSAATGPVEFSGGFGGAGFLTINAGNIDLLGSAMAISRIGIGIKTIPITGNGTATITTSGDITINNNSSIDSRGSMPNNHIVLNPGNLIVNPGGQIIAGSTNGPMDGGDITVNATNSILMNGTALNPAVISMSAPSLGNMLLIANQNANINGTNTIEVLSPAGELTLVVDNASPYNVAPNIGPGTLNISAGATFTSGGPMRIYSSTLTQSTIDPPAATFNGVPFSSSLEDIGVWYPSTGSGSGIPATFYFKAEQQSFLSGSVFFLALHDYSRFQTAVSEAFQEWNYFDPYYQVVNVDVDLTYQTEITPNNAFITTFDLEKKNIYRFFRETFHTYNTLKLGPM